MFEKDENEDKIVPIKEDELKDYLAKKFKKDQKNSFDALGIAAQMLNLANDRDITYSILHKMAIISKMQNQEQKESSFRQVMDYINKSDELKDIEFNGVKLVDYFEKDKDNIFSFFDDFEKITKNEEAPDVNMLRFVCESDVPCTLYNKTADIALFKQLLESKLIYNKQAVSLRDDLDDMEERYKEVQQANFGNWPENSIEIAEDVSIVAMTAIAAVFPPLIILSGIIHLLHANNNKLVNDIANKYQRGRKDLKKNIMKKQQESSAADIKDTRKRATEKRDERFKLLSKQLPKPMKPYVGAYLTTASYDTITAHQMLTQSLNQLTMCNLAMNKAFTRDLPQAQQQPIL